MDMQTIKACPRGHHYRANILHPGQATACPRCDLYVLVALAYGDCQNPPRGCRLLNFRTESITDYQVFCEALSIVGTSYNGFDCRRVIAELRPIFPKLMSVEIGREGSPLIYAYPPYWTHQAIEWTGGDNGTRIPAEEREQLKKVFFEAMERANADEISDEGYALRAWWD
jgi:hypothetical protein